MQKLSVKVDRDYKSELENAGVLWHSTPENVNYWSETGYYQFNSKQIEQIENATTELHGMLLQAGEHIIKKNLFAKFGIPDWVIPHIKKAWEDEPPALFYGRFDFGYDGVNPPKMFEYNCDTPTSLLEASVAQWHWKEHYFPELDQFNSIHERLIEKWAGLNLHGNNFFAYAPDQVGEDLFTVTYLMDTALQAGLAFDTITMGDIGWDAVNKRFIDMDGEPIDTIFKLYPWEWLVNEEFGKHIFETSGWFTSKPKTLWMEPVWKMMWSNKAILPILWDLFPNHPNLLKASFEPLGTNYVKKPILSREGANISIVQADKVTMETHGEYGEEGYIYQEIFELPSFDGKYPVIGSWVVDGCAAGMGIRDGDFITNNLATFVPHVIKN